MDISYLLRQTVSWATVASIGERGDITWNAPTTVAARVVQKRRDLFAKNGEVVTTTSSVTMLAQPSIGDALNGREVVSVDSLVDASGATVGYTALTR